MLSALYFPALRPEPAWARSLSAVVDRLVCYGAVEEDSPVPDCQVRVVAPLGADRSRFLALLRELTGREAEYFKGQLMALASRPGRDRDEASGWELARALHRRSSESEESGRERARLERLWQARLLLKLGEAFSSSEAEIQRELAAVTRRQAELLRALQGEGDDEGARPPLLPGAGAGRQAFRGRVPLGAWAALFLEDRQAESFLVTDDQEAGELLLEEVEKRVPGGTIRLPDLLLPEGAEAVDPVAGRSAERAALVAALSESIAGHLATSPATAALQKAVKDWAAGLAGGADRRSALSLYLLPALPVRQFLGALSGLPQPDDAPRGSALVLLGVASICKD